MDFPQQNHVLVPKTSNAAWPISTSKIHKIIQFCTAERVPKSSNDVQTLTSQYFWDGGFTYFFSTNFDYNVFEMGWLNHQQDVILMLSEESRWWDSTKKVLFFSHTWPVIYCEKFWKNRGFCVDVLTPFPKGAFLTGSVLVFEKNDGNYLESWVLNIINSHKLVAKRPLNRVKNPTYKLLWEPTTSHNFHF